jgi:hypothetical protein
MANADLRTKQYYCVELLSTEKVDVCNNAGDIAIGVLQNKPAAGQAAAVRTAQNSKSKVVSDGSGTAIGVGDWVGTNASGKAVKKTTNNDWILGQAEDPSTADGTIITIRLQPGYLGA